MGVWKFRGAYFLVVCVGAYFLGTSLPESTFSYAVFGLYGTFALAFARPVGRKFGVDDVFDNPRTGK